MCRIPGWTNVSSLLVRFVLFAGVAVCALFAGPAWAGVIYVKSDATGANNGDSWADAYTDLQAALAAAEWGDEIWVAKGTYTATTGTLRAVSFVLQAGVGLYGGFAGAETELGQRDWKANATMLSGDIGTTDTADNSYRVVIGAHLAVLDGFTITGGRGNGGMHNTNCLPIVANCAFSGNTGGVGGGMYNEYSSPTVTNCTFSGNTADVYGGGMYNWYSSPIVTSCTFTGNKTFNPWPAIGYGLGGGMYNEYSSPTVTNCTFSGNTASGTFGRGGGIYNKDGSPTVTNCTFSGNTAISDGGGMYNYNSSPTVTNCTFSGNSAGYGGGMYNSDSPTVINCTFTSNTATIRGGGMSGGGTVANCIFWDNTAPLGAEIYKGGGTPTFSHCDIRGSGGSGASWDTALGVDGGGNIGDDPRFVAPATPLGPDELWRTHDDGLSLLADSPCIGVADPAAAPEADILGLTRGAAPDIGAYEFFSGGYCTLTYNAGPGGMISGTTPQTVDYGTSGTAVEAVPVAGYHFVQWGDASAANPRTDTNVTTDMTVTAIFALSTRTAKVICVKTGATGANNGLSWADAYTDLQAGLAAAEWGDEIWVAKGTYKPTSGTDRTVSFLLQAGVGLYGGFAGAETERAQRDWKANATILSGDIGTVGSATDNTLHVVIGAHLAALDGFTVKGGSNYGSGGYGGGMYNKDCSPTVTNCTFSGNMADWLGEGSGGGMYNYYSSPIVTSCTFSGNSAGYGGGGGMANSWSSPTVTNCTFSDNTAGGDGGGMYNYISSPTVTGCTFRGNKADDQGGGMYNFGYSSPTVTNCTFSGNTAACGMYGLGGGGMYNEYSSPTVTNCTFSGNSAHWYGGGMYGGGTFTNCTFTSNAASRGGGVYGWGTFTSCTFTGNKTFNPWPGMYGRGGGVYGSGRFTSCTFSGNTADYGGGMYNGGSPIVTNCTFSGNTAISDGGGMHNEGSTSKPTVTNCIFWDNSAPVGAEICTTSTATPTFSHCDIRGSGGSGALWNPALGVDGGGNIGGDPRFVAPATPAGPDGLWRTSDDGLRLQSDSPCIGAADPAVAPTTDILGLPRGSAPDIGAYEFASGGGSWTLTYNAGAGGSITGTTPQTVASGADGSQVTAVPNAGYRFVRWSDGVMTASRTDTNVTADINVTAIFAPSEPAAAQDWALYE